MTTDLETTLELTSAFGLPLSEWRKAARTLATFAQLAAATTRFPQIAMAFPDYDQSTLPTLPDGWTDDTANAHDCPQFVSPDRRYTLYVDWPAAADRLNDTRYQVARMDDQGGSDGESSFGDSDDVAMSLAAIEDDRLMRAWAADGAQPHGDAYKALRAREEDLRAESVSAANFNPVTEVSTPMADVLGARADAIDLFIFNARA